MTVAEQEVLSAVYELADGRPVLVSYDKIADRLGTTLTAVKSFSLLLKNRNFAIVTFEGVQLTPTGLEQAKNEREVFTD
jgi:hypothetical protein